MLYRTPSSRYFHVWNKTTQQGGAPKILAKYKRRVYAYYDDLLNIMTAVPPSITAHLHTDDAFLLTHARALRDRASRSTTSVLTIGRKHPGSTPIFDDTQGVYEAIHAKLPDVDFPDMKMQGESYSHTEQYDVPTPWIRYDEAKGHLVVCVNVDGVKTMAIIDPASRDNLMSHSARAHQRIYAPLYVMPTIMAMGAWGEAVPIKLRTSKLRMQIARHFSDVSFLVPPSNGMDNFGIILGRDFLDRNAHHMNFPCAAVDSTLTLIRDVYEPTDAHKAVASILARDVPQAPPIATTDEPLAPQQDPRVDATDGRRYLPAGLATALAPPLPSPPPEPTTKRPARRKGKPKRQAKPAPLETRAHEEKAQARVTGKRARRIPKSFSAFIVYAMTLMAPHAEAMTTQDYYDMRGISGARLGDQGILVASIASHTPPPPPKLFHYDIEPTKPLDNHLARQPFIKWSEDEARSPSLIAPSRMEVPNPPSISFYGCIIETPPIDLSIGHHSDPPHDHYATVKGLGGVLGFLVSIWGSVLNPMGKGPLSKKNRQPG